jgi:hypothetical protein
VPLAEKKIAFEVSVRRHATVGGIPVLPDREQDQFIECIRGCQSEQALQELQGHLALRLHAIDSTQVAGLRATASLI